MVKVTLLGDSIRISYAEKVAERLGADFEVFSPVENGRFSKNTLRGIHEWYASMKDTRIVHWNNGLWDVHECLGDGVFTDEAEYVTNMLRIADNLLKRYDKVIFATTTPVHPSNLFFKNDVIIRYNEVLVPLLKEKGVIINDLHTPIWADPDRYICEDKLHLSEEGVEICVGLVTDIIKKTAETLDK